jgi:hypothetical protein
MILFLKLQIEMFMLETNYPFMVKLVRAECVRQQAKDVGFILGIVFSLSLLSF